MFLTKENLLKLARAYSKLPILAEVAQKKAEIDALQTVISEEQRARLNQKIRLDWNYHSNCIEGNSLTLGQTTAFIMYGLTASGKPFKDYIDIKNHNELLNWVIQWSKDSNNVLSETAIRDMHTLLMGENFTMQVHTSQGQINKTYQSGAYKTQTNQTITVTGETHYYATAEDTPYLMAELLAFYHDAINSSDINTLVVAALFHYQFVSIHPFPDGNGRLVRLLMNLILMQQKYQPVIVRSNPEQKTAYFTALQKAHTEEYETFINLIAEYELAACALFIKAAHNESIEDPDDIDKEIELLKKTLTTNPDYLQSSFSMEKVNEIVNGSVENFAKEIYLACLKFKDLFNEILAVYECDGVFIANFNQKLNINVFDYFKKIAEEQIKRDDDYLFSISFRFELNNFKLKSNTFDVSLSIYVSFDDDFYTIECNLYTEKTVHLENYKLQYHQNITTEQAKTAAQKIAQQILNTIKQLAQQ